MVSICGVFIRNIYSRTFYYIEVCKKSLYHVPTASIANVLPTVATPKPTQQNRQEIQAIKVSGILTFSISGTAITITKLLTLPTKEISYRMEHSVIQFHGLNYGDNLRIMESQFSLSKMFNIMVKKI